VKTLHDTRPSWVVELSTDLPNNREVLQLFVDAGYRLFWFYPALEQRMANGSG
jgi:hypothetical protein